MVRNVVGSASGSAWVISSIRPREACRAAARSGSVSNFEPSRSRWKVSLREAISWNSGQGSGSRSSYWGIAAILAGDVGQG